MALAIPASASAATYCVYTGANTCPAGPTAIAGLQQGLDAAAGTPERDTVMVRPGTYDAGGSNGFDYNSASPVDLVGAGAVGTSSTSTIIGDSSAVDFQSTLRLIGNTGSTVSGVRVDTVLADSVIGLDTSAAVDAVAVTTPAGFGGIQIGVFLHDGAALRRSDVEAEGPGGNAVAVGGSVTIEDSNLVSNRIGVQQAQPVSLKVRRTRIQAVVVAGLQGGGGDAVFEDVLTVPPPGPVPTSGFSATGGLNLRIDHMTMVGNGSQNSRAFGLAATSSDLHVTVRNSVVRGFEEQVRRQSFSGDAVDAAVEYSDVQSPLEAPGSSGPGAVTGTANLDVDPGFTAPGLGDYELAAGSPLVDAGDPAGLSAGETALDLDGAPRVLDASGSCTPRTDMGAYERVAGPRAPRALASGGAAGALIGQVVAFDGSASCDPDGGVLGYSWRFDDGATAAGPTASHAFATAGSHHAVLTVTDPTGRTDTAVAAVTVTAPAAAFGGATIVSRIVHVGKKGIAPVKLFCPGTASGRCAGKLTLSSGGKSVGSHTFSIARGHSARIPVKLGSLARRTLRRRGSLTVAAKAVARDASGKPKTTRAQLALLPGT